MPKWDSYHKLLSQNKCARLVCERRDWCDNEQCPKFVSLRNSEQSVFKCLLASSWTGHFNPNVQCRTKLYGMWEWRPGCIAASSDRSITFSWTCSRNSLSSTDKCVSLPFVSSSRRGYRNAMNEFFFFSLFMFMFFSVFCCASPHSVFFFFFDGCRHLSPLKNCVLCTLGSSFSNTTVGTSFILQIYNNGKGGVGG